VPDKKPAKDRLAVEIKRFGQRADAGELDDWQRLHALMQLEGEDIRRRTNQGEEGVFLSCENRQRGLLEQMVTAGLSRCAGGWRAVLKNPCNEQGRVERGMGAERLVGRTR